MSLGYNSRLSQIGVGKADPVLSSFSPVGNSGRVRGDIVAQIQPRTSTPIHSSTISRNMVSASSSNTDGVVLHGQEERKTDSLLAAQGDGLGRLSISGRLSLGQPPATPLTRERATTYVPPPSFKKEEPPHLNYGGSKSDLIKDRFSGIEGRLTATSNERPTVLEEKPSLVSSTRHVSDATSTMAASSLSSTITGNIPEFIKSIVEKSIAEAMSEIRNDVQNLHIEMIKQSLAQQNSLQQILSNLPGSYKKLAEDHRLLQEENERLKFRLDS